MSHYGDLALYDLIMDCFDALPVAALVNNDYLCVHGGISPDFEFVEDINKINRFEEPSLKGLLW